MKYNKVTKEFTAPNGVKRVFTYRENTNDYNTIVGAFCEDEYGIRDLEFEKGDVVVDIGAHIGSVTMLLSTVRDDLKIHSLEPMPENFDLLMENMKASGTECEINLYKQACWFYDDDDVKMYYGDSSEDGRIHKFIGSMFFHRDFYHKKLYKKVNTISLSELFDANHIFNCKFMKLDAEGAEYGILKGTPEQVLKMIERIHGEYHNIEQERIKKPRAMLLKQCKGVFEDITGEPEGAEIGDFRFVRKE